MVAGDFEPNPRRSNVSRINSVDAITGLPLWEYRFVGAATLEPGTPTPSLAWRVLDVATEGAETRLRAESNIGAEPLAQRPHALDDRVAGLLLGALREAQTLGCVHGDLTVDRIYRRGDRVWIEGYGVPWQPLARWEDDVEMLLRGMLTLPNTRLSPGMRERLQQASVHSPWSDAAPSVAPTNTPPSPRVVASPPASARARARTSPQRPVRERQPVDASLHTAWTRVTRVVARWMAALPRVAQNARAWMQRMTSRVAAPTRATQGGNDGGFMDTRQRLLVGLLIVLGGMWWGSLTARPSSVEVAVWGGAARLVDVRVEPSGLPPVALVVVESPAGSVYTAGSVLATVPGRVLLDQDGRWRLEVRFAGARSEQVTLRVPFERELSFVHPQHTTLSAP